MTKKQEAYIESQLVLIRVSFKKFLINKEYVDKQHEKSHRRLMRRYWFAYEGGCPK